MVIIKKISNRQQDVLDILIDAKGFPLSTREIAKRVGMDWKTANRHLEILYGKRRTVYRVEKRKITLWYLTYQARNHLYDF